MKFEIYGKDLKKAVDRVGIVVTKKSSIPVYSTVKLEAKENVITVSAATSEQVVELVVSDASKDIYGDILEEGFCFVNLEKLKKIYNIKDKILVFSDKNNLTLKASKKKCSIPIEQGIEYDDILACFKNLNANVVDVLKTKESKFVYTLTDLKSLIEKSIEKSKYRYREIFTAIHLSANRKRLSVVSDVMCAERKIDEEFFVNDGSYHIPQEVATHLNKISNKKDNLITIKANNNIIEIDGEDYVYKSRLLKVKELDPSIDRIVDTAIGKDDVVVDGAYSFDIDADEWCKIVKEYSDLIKSNKVPMVLYLSGNKLKTYIHSEIETSDCIEISNVKTDCQDGEMLTLCGLNPAYLLKILSLFKHGIGNVTVSGVSAKETNGHWTAKRPIKVCNGEYTCILMSMTMSSDDVNQSRKFIFEEEK